MADAAFFEERFEFCVRCVTSLDLPQGSHLPVSFLKPSAISYPLLGFFVNNIFRGFLIFCCFFETCAVSFSLDQSKVVFGRGSSMVYSLGEKIKELRTKQGLSQEELADKLNAKFGTTINKGMISKWENNIGEPRLETARILALFFNVSLDELLGIDPKQDDIQTLAAHHEGEEWTEEELAEIERFKEFVRMKRRQREQGE